MRTPLLSVWITCLQSPADGRDYEVITATFAEAAGAVAGATWARIGRSQPAESQERGIENSDQPQSKQTRTSGEGVIGGWLSVRWQLR